jgi:hypothetical protein
VKVTRCKIQLAGIGLKYVAYHNIPPVCMCLVSNIDNTVITFTTKRRSMRECYLAIVAHITILSGLQPAVLTFVSVNTDNNNVCKLQLPNNN